MDWSGKKAIIQLVKENKPLTFTADNIHILEGMIFFTDFKGEKFAYPINSISEIREVQ